ncbi:PadR family transcriptional regulator [Enemella sp. A6]|uniref:PadR family transcriptional regulator n=1 Tax=Enemella sp. A6 TaxID=3440152 RepID=UPI003EBA0AA9
MPRWAMMETAGPRRGGRRGGGRGMGGGPPGAPWRGMGEGFGFDFGGPGRGRGRARRGDVRLAALALLAEKPRNGYQIIREIADRTQGAWKPSPGAVYPALNQLEDEGLIVAAEGDKTFTVTEEGRAAAAEIDPKPWDAINRETADAYPEDVAELWTEFRRLADAVRAVTSSGTDDDRRKTAELLTETRRRIFGMLASDS